MTSDPTGDLIASVTWKPDVLRLEIDTSGGWYIAIDNDYTVDGGEFGKVESRTRADEAASAIRAHVGGTIAEFDVLDSGSLRMTIGPIRVAVDPAYDYEAWHATGPPPDRHMIICQPGGGIA